MPNFNLKEGFSAETSGGILALIDENKANDFVRESMDSFGQEVWKIGKVIKGDKNAEIVSDVEVISVKDSFLK